MVNNAEMLRTAFISKLKGQVSDEEYKRIILAFDETIDDFDISRKEKGIITLTLIPEAIKDYIASQYVRNLSLKTILQYKYRLIHFFKAVKKKIEDITATDVRLYLNWYKDTNHVSNSTLEHARIVINIFFEWLVMNGYINKNPIATVEHIKFKHKKREALTSYELELMRYNCKDIREKALVDFIFSTGMRVCECSNVLISDIDWQQKSVKIRHGKGDKERIVFFNAESELSLEMYLATRKDDNEYLFVSTKKPYNKLSERSIQIIIHEVGARCNIHAFPHKLRHTFATHGIRCGMPLERLQALMGHESPQTTLIYAKLDHTDLQREHQRVYAS